MLIIVYRWFPIKLAVTQDASHPSNNIYVKHVRVTGFDWVLVDEEGHELEYIHIEGEEPLALQYGVRYGDNVYAFTGNFVDNIEFDGKSYKSFKVSSWDIVFPVQRNTLLPNWLLPSRYLTMADFRWW